jgi:hypothetical protein
MSAFFLFEYLLGGRGKIPYLLSSAVAFFLAYLAKISNLLVLPGFVLAIALVWRRPRDAGIFLGVLAALFALEVALYALLTDNAFGRVSVILSDHLRADNRHLPVVRSFWGLFERYGPKSLFRAPFFGAAFYAQLVAVVLLTANRRWNRELLTISLVLASYAVGLLLAVKDISPWVSVHGFHFRHLLPIAPLLVLFLLLAATRYLDVRFVVPVGGAGRSALYTAVAVAIVGYCYLAHFPGFKRHPIALAVRNQARTEGLFASGVPVISMERRRPRAMYYYESCLWDAFDDPAYRDTMPEALSVTGDGANIYLLAHHETLAGKLSAQPKRLLRKWRRERTPVLYLKLHDCPRRVVGRKCIKVLHRSFREVRPGLVRRLLKRKSAKGRRPRKR